MNLTSTDPASIEPVERRPLYARALRLRRISPSGWLCFVFLEGAIALGVLLALAELVSWWGVLVLPITVAVMVKLNDMVAGISSRPALAAPPVAATAPVLRSATVPIGEESTTRLPGVTTAGIKRPWVEQAENQHQRARQAATRRYE
jgi:hypothetical protein